MEKCFFCLQKNSYDLEFVEHKHAVESIRRACDEGSKIKLTVAHPTISSSHDQTPQKPTPTPSKPVTTNQPNGQRALSHDELRELPA